MAAQELRIGTRASTLALAQAHEVAALIERASPATTVRLIEITTSGDRSQDAGEAAAAAGDKRRWVAEIEDSLLAGRVDLAVHSAKDVPAQLATGLELVGAPARGDARDVICGAAGVSELAAGARVGTSSLRRAAQLSALRDDIEVVALRGNVDTRLRKLADGSAGVDAIVIALAGLERIGRADAAGAPLDAELVVPAAGQGTLALEARGDDGRTRALAEAISDPATLTALAAERALVARLGADCHTPVGAHARAGADPGSGSGSGVLELSVFVGLPDGSAWVRDRLAGDAHEPAALGERVAERLLTAGARELLARAATWSPA